MNFVSTANQIRQICGELEAVMKFYSRYYVAILLELLLFRYLNLLPDKYNLAHYNYIKSEWRKSGWPCRTVFFYTRFGVIIAVFRNILVMRRRYAVTTGIYVPKFRLNVIHSSSGQVV